MFHWKNYEWEIRITIFSTHFGEDISKNTRVIIFTGKYDDKYAYIHIHSNTNINPFPNTVYISMNIKTHPNIFTNGLNFGFNN